MELNTILIKKQRENILKLEKNRLKLFLNSKISNSKISNSKKN